MFKKMNVSSFEPEDGCRNRTRTRNLARAEPTLALVLSAEYD